MTTLERISLFRIPSPKPLQLRQRRLIQRRANPTYDLGYDPDVIIVGAGLAGLACAKTLRNYNLTCTLFESSNNVGGRVKTEKYKGFLLDYGFQIFLTAYPEAKKMLDYESLRLKPFYNGAMVWHEGNFYRVADPFRHPIAGVASITNPIGTVEDKARVGLLRLALAGKSDEDILADDESTVIQRLRDLSFSPSMIDRFFRPFFGGIFFDNDLSVSSRLFEFVMKMLANGENTLPENGIGEITKQLAQELQPGSIRLNYEVEKVHGTDGNHVLPAVTLKGSETSIVAQKAVVIATDGPAASRITDPSLLASFPSKQAEGVGTCCLYFSAAKAPMNGENVLYLNGSRSGIVNNCCFPSTVSQSYAPPGETLVSVSTVGTYPEMSDEKLESNVRKEMGKWFGPFDVAAWRLLKIFRIPYAQPNQSPPTDFERPVRLGNKIYICGDHRDSATFDGALKSGRRAALAVLQDVQL